jgi:membrane protease YdiL (CAAX protease family)
MTITAPSPSVGRTKAEPAEATDVPQYSLRKILTVWAAAALPMAFLSWIAAPWLAHRIDGPGSLSKALILCLTAGVIWQFVLVVGLVAREQRSLRWSKVRQALWLRSPRSPRTGRIGGRVWLVVPIFLIGFGLEEFVPAAHHAVSRDLPEFLDSVTGHALLSGSWAWFGVIVALIVFNTVLGEELLFRGLLLPRMNGEFGKRDWIANGVLFAVYHLHMPWVIPATLADTFFLAYPAKRYRSALIPIVVHSAQSVVILALTLSLVLQ